MTDSARVQTLTIYLARHSLSPSDLIKASARLAPYRLTVNESTNGELFIQQPEANYPDWAEFFDGYISAEAFGKNSSAGAALLLNVREKWFAVTFGTGRFLLTPDSWEDRFGLKVALNCIPEDMLRSIDKHSLDQLLRHTREQASRDATAREFGFDIEQDLLRAVTGKPVDKAFGQRISGSDSLHVTVPLHLNQLPELLDSLYDRFKDTNYRTKFPWVDQIGELTDSRLEGELDDLLVTKIASGQTGHIWMAVPELISWDRVSGFRFPSRGTSAQYPDIHLEHFLKAVGGPALVKIEDLTRRRVVCVDHDGRKLHEWNAHKCRYAEIDHGGESFLLSNGRWYKVKSDFVHETNTAYARIPDCEVGFPEFMDDSEGKYLERMVKLDPECFALMDQKMILHGGGHSQVEFCDLFATNGDIFHVKRYGQSSALSHLFAQGLVSGELFQMDSAFRLKVKNELPKSHKLQCPKDRPKQGQFRVVFAIISDRAGELRLPFFSRLNLKHAARRLEAYGFRVAKAKIDVNEVFSKTAKFRSRGRT